MKIKIVCGEGENVIKLHEYTMSQEDRDNIIAVLNCGGDLVLQIPSAKPKNWRPE